MTQEIQRFSNPQFSLEQLTGIAEKLQGSLVVNKEWSVKELVSVMLLGQELGLTPTIALNHISIIGDKPCLDVPMQQALLLKAGVTFEILEDATSLYQYGDRSSGATADKKAYLIMYNQDELTPEERLDKEKYRRMPVHYDIRTTARGTRQYKLPDGSYKTIVATRSYCISDAIAAGLTAKANWKHVKAMLWHRAVGLVIDVIGQDVTANIHSPEEMDINYNTQNTENIPLADVIESNSTITTVEVEEVKAL